jgi:predicted glycosyltransferase
MAPWGALRVVVYCQTLTGLGHHVRALSIARALAAGGHDVHFATGARRFPGDRDAPRVRFVELPGLQRAGGRLAPLVPGADLPAVLAERSRILRAELRRIRPDALLVEHYPFGKVELAAEAAALVEAARPARVICSLRDIGLRGRYDAASGEATDEEHGEAVCRALHALFDVLLVHGDPAVTRLEEQLPWAARIPVPVAYTGYVARPFTGREEEGARGTVVVSVGGGVEAVELLGPVRAAWARVRGDRRLVEFPGPFAPERARFTPDLASWLSACDLSVSRAGYNTCVDVLRARARALLVPSPRMSDQRLRARRLQELGLAQVLAPEDASPEGMAVAIRLALLRPRPEHPIRLDGAERTRALVEAVVAGERVS